MIKYLTAEIVIAINERWGGAGAGLKDRDVLEGQLGRPASGFGDVEHFPTLWDKAGVLLHGLASTQAFLDGNKRAAWLATQVFLKENGVELGNVDVVTQEVLVLAAAGKAIGVEQVAEWLHRHANVSWGESGEPEFVQHTEVRPLTLSTMSDAGMVSVPYVLVRYNVIVEDEPISWLGNENARTAWRNFAIFPAEALGAAETVLKVAERQHELMLKMHPPSATSQP